jgi:protein TonB
MSDTKREVIAVIVALLFASCQRPLPTSTGRRDEATTVGYTKAAAGSPDAPIRAGDKVGTAVLVHYVKPVYPEVLRQRRVEGLVHLRVSVGINGAPTGIEYVSGPRELVRYAEDAVNKWRYRPARLDGHPVGFVTDALVQFTASQ